MLQKPFLEVIRPNWKAPSNVEAFFTLRTGGVSSGVYGCADGFNGLNLGTHVGDNGYCVRQNRHILTDMAGAKLQWLNQVHSSRVVDTENLSTDAIPDADAVITTQVDIGCVVMTADCLPVLLCDESGSIVAASHAGWKGLADGVLQNTVNAMRQKIQKPNAKILAWLGPRIGEPAFTVQEDVRQYYLNSVLKEYVEKGILAHSEGYKLNLAYLAKCALQQVNVEEVTDCGLSTFEDPLRFYSYRRDRITGRHAAVIIKKG